MFLRTLNNSETPTLMNNVIDTYHLQERTREDPLVKPKVIKYTDSCWL